VPKMAVSVLWHNVRVFRVLRPLLLPGLPSPGAYADICVTVRKCARAVGAGGLAVGAWLCVRAAGEFGVCRGAAPGLCGVGRGGPVPGGSALSAVVGWSRAGQVDFRHNCATLRPARGTYSGFHLTAARRLVGLRRGQKGKETFPFCPNLTIGARNTAVHAERREEKAAGNVQIVVAAKLQQKGTFHSHAYYSLFWHTEPFSACREP